MAADFFLSPGDDPTGDSGFQSELTQSFDEIDLENFSQNEVVSTLVAGSRNIDITPSLAFNIDTHHPYSVPGTIDQMVLFHASAITFIFPEPVEGFGAWVFDDGFATAESARMTVLKTDGTTSTSMLLESDEGEAVHAIDVLSYDTDPDADDDPSNFTLNSTNSVAVSGLCTGTGLITATVSDGVEGVTEFDPGSDFDELAVGEIATVVVGYTMSDDDDLHSSSVLTITAEGENDTPQIIELASSNSKPCESSLDGTLSISGAFSDVDLTDTHTVTIDWGDGSGLETLTDVDQGADSFAGSHSYQGGGILAITVTVEDGHGSTSLTSTTTGVATGVGVNVDALYVIGTPQTDLVTINRQGNDLLKVHADFLTSGNFKTLPASGVEKIIAYLCEGYDHLTITGNIDIPAIIHAGADDDHINAGGGPSVLLGEAGDDHLDGGQNRDLLIGGIGEDRLVGGKEDDVLIGGTTNLDEDDDALMVAQLAWNYTDAYQDRVAAIDLLLSVNDDEDEDKLTGSSDQDLFYDGLGDDLTDASTKKDLETVL